MKIIEHFIDGRKYSGTSKRTSFVYDPATGEETAKVTLGSSEDLNKTVEIAKEAFQSWSNTPPLQRARVLFKFKELIEKNEDELVKIIVSEHGKVYEDAKGSLTRGLEVVEYACGIPQMLKGEFTENVGKNVDSWSLRQPLGVCAGITPFNFPAMVPMWMFPMAIACGNTFILKPSEKDPSCSIRLAELFKESGLPNGVFNVVNGDKEVVDAIIDNKDISAVSFVGSTPIAKYIYENCAKNEKRVQALGGAKNHCVVMPDCDLDQAVNGLMGAAYGSAGERCMAQSVAVAVGNIGDNLIKNLKTKVENLKVGPGMDKNSQMGPLVTKDHLEKVKGYVDIGIQEGAELVVDGRNLKLQGYEKGYFMGGCLFDKVNKNMKIYKEEIFGPVLSMMTTETYEEALNLVNDHELGNGAAVFTKSGNIAKHFTENAKIGMIGVNVPIPVPVAYHSFGGWKRSLFGDHSMHGPEGVRFYTKLKTATVTWVEDNAGPEFTIPVLS